MKTFYIIFWHSFSDLITNSSTDIFACKTEKTVEELEQILLELYNAGEETKTPLTLDKFKESVATVKLTSIRDFFVSSSDWLTNYDWNNKTGEHIEIPQYESVEEFCEIHFGGADPYSEILMVEGASDNSIPYWLQGFIESTFNSFRIHCG